MNDALIRLGIGGENAATIYDHVYDIVAALQIVNLQSKIDVAVTGRISELLCEYGLMAATALNNAQYYRMPIYWEWIGDYYVIGEPFNLIVSIKSFTAKERLLASGSANALSPTVGWGLFKDPNEFSCDRLFPTLTAASWQSTRVIGKLAQPALDFTNINGRPMMRCHNHFVTDIRNAIGPNGRVNPRLL